MSDDRDRLALLNLSLDTLLIDILQHQGGIVRDGGERGMDVLH